ncbi:MAG: hypothetical protein P4L51_20385 [Puia sp.]|nr:hypothetical protein [Puia sp.]
MNSRKYLLVILLAASRLANAQRPADTTALIDEFDKVLSFAVQPYVYYTSVTSLHSGPMIAGKDSATVLRNNFYKVNDDLYYGNDKQETYLQDSLLVQIDHQRKTIQLRKVDVATKKRMDILPLKRGEVQKMLRRQYELVGMPGEGDTGRILVRSREGVRTTGVSTEMALQYSKRSYLPRFLEMSLRTRQPGSEQMEGALRSQGFDISRMVSEKEGSRSLVITQTVSIQFGEISLDREKALNMPSWKDKVNYDPASNGFSGVGACTGYEMIRTF